VEYETKLEKMTENFGCVIWCGGLNGRYNEDAKKLFPDRKYLHNLPECSINPTNAQGILDILYNNYRDNLLPHEFLMNVINNLLSKNKEELNLKEKILDLSILEVNAKLNVSEVVEKAEDEINEIFGVRE